MLSLWLFVVDGEGLIAGGSWPAAALLGVRVGFGLPAAGWPGAIVVGGGFGLAFLLGPPPLGSVTGVGRLLLLLLVVAALGWLTPPGGCAGGGCGRLLL